MHGPMNVKLCSGWLLSQSGYRLPRRWRRYGPPICCCLLAGINRRLTQKTAKI